MRPARASTAPTFSRSAIAIAGVCFVLAAAALFLPRATGRTRALHVLVVDASASVTRRRPERLIELREEFSRAAKTELERHARERADLALILYGDAVELVTGPISTTDWLRELGGGKLLQPGLDPASDGQSRLARALELARDLFDERAVEWGGAPGRVTILGDGRFHGPDPAPLIAGLATRGIQVTQRLPGPAVLGDAALVELNAPRDLPLGAPAAALAHIVLDPGIEAPGPFTLEIKIALTESDGTTHELVREEKLSAGAHQLLLELPRPVREGLHELRVALVLAGDPVRENDTLVRKFTVGHGLTIGVAGGDARARAAARRLVSTHVPDASVVELDVVHNPEQVFDCDALVAVDLPFVDLDRATLEAFLRSGGGLFFTGGWRSLEGFRGASEVARTSVADLLPFVPGPGPPPERDIVFLVDGSGSMAGEPFSEVRRSLAQLVRALDERESLTLQFFTGALGSAYTVAEPGQSEAQRERALRLLFERRVPGGTTAILRSLETFARQRLSREPPRRETFVVLLSDGREAEDHDLEQRIAALPELLSRAGVTLAAVAIGPRADTTFLARLVPGVKQAQELAGLAEALREAVHGDDVIDGAFMLQPVAQADRSAAANEILRTQLRALSAPWPGGQRALDVALAPDAQGLWTSAEGRPAVALRAHGKGLVAQWSSAPLPGWGMDAARAAPFGPLLRRLAASRAETARPSLTLEEREDGAWLVWEGLPPEAPPRMKARVLIRSASQASWPMLVRPEPAETGLVFTPPVWLGNDPLTTRVAVLPNDPLFAGAVLALAFEPADAQAAGIDPSITVPAPRSREFGPSRMLRIVPVTQSTEASPGPGRHPVVFALGALGLGLLCLGALSGLFRGGRGRGQGIS